MSEENPLGLLTTKEAAAYLRVSDKTIEALRANGELPVVRVGGRVFYKRDCLDTFVNEQVVSTKQKDQKNGK